MSSANRTKLQHLLDLELLCAQALVRLRRNNTNAAIEGESNAG